MNKIAHKGITSLFVFLCQQVRVCDACHKRVINDVSVQLTFRFVYLYLNLSPTGIHYC